MKTSEFWNNIGRYFAGELSEAERQQMETHIASDPELKETVSQLKIVWQAQSDQKRSDVDQAWNKVQNALDKQQKYKEYQPAPLYRLKKTWVWYGAVAAGIAVILFIALFLLQQSFHWNSIPYKGDEARIEYATMKGQREQRILPDGSKVYLNADSRIIIPEGFLDTNRFVYLQGEAYFEVSDYKDLPFEVYSSGFIAIAQHKAAFNVQAFPEQNNVILSVKKGRPYVSKIKATNAETPDLPMMKLRPARKMRSSEAIAFNKHTDSFKPVKEKNDKAYFGWKEDILYFDDSDASILVHKVERWYGVNIKYNACLLKNSISFSAEFHKAKLKDVLARISKDLDVAYAIDGTDIFLKRKCQC